MPDVFEQKEKIYRAVIPLGMYVKDDGSITSAAFKWVRLSVDRQMRRDNQDAVNFIMGNHKDEIIASVEYGILGPKDIDCMPEPTNDNEYHCVLLRKDGNERLSDSQAKYLSRRCLVEYKPN